MREELTEQKAMDMTSKVQDVKAEARFFDQEPGTKIRVKRAWRLEEGIDRVFQMLGINSMSNKHLLTLDAGCGTGGWSKMLARKGFVVIAADISAESIKVAGNRSKEGKMYISIIRSDVTKAPFKSGAFDLCFCALVLHHFPDLSSVVPELSRIVKNNGKIMLFEPNGSNIVFRATGSAKEIIPKEWIVKQQMTTTNETAHDAKSYIDALKSNGFIASKVVYYVSADQALVYDRQIIEGFFRDYGILAGFLMFVRCLSLKIILNLLPRHLGMGSLLITATKHSVFRTVPGGARFH